MTKEESLIFVLNVLSSKMAITSKNTRDKALEAAKEHNITAVDLLEKLQELVWKI